MPQTKLQTKTATYSVTVAASLMVSLSSVAMFLSWGMMAVAVGFAIAPKMAVRIAVVPVGEGLAVRHVWGKLGARG